MNRKYLLLSFLLTVAIALFIVSCVYMYNFHEELFMLMLGIIVVVVVFGGLWYSIYDAMVEDLKEESLVCEECGAGVDD